jgi:hypothetical protein
MSLFLRNGNVIHESTPTVKWCHAYTRSHSHNSDAIMGRIGASVNQPLDCGAAVDGRPTTTAATSWRQ